MITSMTGVLSKIAELLHRSLRTLLPGESKGPWMRFAGMIASGRSDSSRTIDDVVYATRR